MYIFLDESGRFVENSSEKYFVVAAFTVDDPRRTAKQFRSRQHKKFPRVLRDLPEIKFSKISADGKLRLDMMKFISRLGIRIHYVYFHCKNIQKNYWKGGQLQGGLLYADVISETLDMYLPTEEGELRIFCDQRHLKGLLQGEFYTLIKNRLLLRLSKRTLVQIEMIDSATNENIQIAD
jgi:hypothetical protein